MVIWRSNAVNRLELEKMNQTAKGEQTLLIQQLKLARGCFTNLGLIEDISIHKGGNSGFSVRVAASQIISVKTQLEKALQLN